MRTHNVYFVVNTIDDTTKRFASLISACKYVASLPQEEKEINLLGDNIYNYDYMQPAETLEEYYKRMRYLGLKLNMPLK